MRGYDAEKEELIGHNSYGTHQQVVRIPLARVHDYLCQIKIKSIQDLTSKEFRHLSDDLSVSAKDRGVKSKYVKDSYYTGEMDKDKRPHGIGQLVLNKDGATVTGGFVNGEPKGKMNRNFPKLPD